MRLAHTIQPITTRPRSILLAYLLLRAALEEADAETYDSLLHLGDETHRLLTDDELEITQRSGDKACPEASLPTLIDDYMRAGAK